MMRRGVILWCLTTVLLILAGAGVAAADQRCAVCGTVNSDQAQFCKNCGARLESRPATGQQARQLSASAAVLGSVVVISSEPGDADIEVDGIPRGRTPLELRDLSAGRHTYRVSKRGYASYSGSFTIIALIGTIVVTTEPVGAEVFLDGAPRGRAGEGGLALLGIPYGRHTVKARLEGYKEVTKTVDLQTPGPYGVTLRLGSGKGFLVVTSSPDSARLSIANRPSGTTPFFGELNPDRYVLNLTKKGYVDWVGYTEVYQAETANVRVTMERLRTRKIPFLIAGSLGIAAGGVSAWMGEQSYARYQSAQMPDSARYWRGVTERWDLGRNIALGAGGALCVTWLLVRW